MATPRRNSRAVAAARTGILEQLKDDHKRVKKAYRDFNKLDPETQPDECERIVRQVLQELQVHASIEEELLYPAARDAIADEDLVDEAEVEHESVHALIDQLNGMGPSDEKFAARFTVLCEYVLHHVKEEEGEMFPQLEKARLDWETLATRMASRRAELMPPDDGAATAASDGKTAATADSAPAAGSGSATSSRKGASSGSRAGKGAASSG